MEHVLYTYSRACLSFQDVKIHPMKWSADQNWKTLSGWGPSHGIPKIHPISNALFAFSRRTPLIPRCPKVSQGVPRCPRCPKVSQGVPRCPKVSQGVPRCPKVSKVSQGVPRCPQGVPRCPRARCAFRATLVRKLTEWLAVFAPGAW